MFFKTFAILIYLLQTQASAGQSLIGSSRPIVTTVGEDIILPCAFNPPRDVAGLTLEWSRPDLDLRFVYVWRSHDELTVLKNSAFTGRTSLFTEELKNGNISLKLTKVKTSDSGTYRCFLPEQGIETFVELKLVVTGSPPVVSVSSVDVWRSAVVLQCDSGAWYPEPELLWLDSEGRLLSAERTHTHTRPDGLYNVSSRVTVEQSSTFTCRVSQSSTNITTQTSVQIQDGFVGVKMFPVIIFLAVGLAVFIGLTIIFSFLFCKTKHTNETNENQQELQISIPKDSSNTKITKLEQENESLKTQLDWLQDSSNTKITFLEQENKSLKAKVVQKVRCLREISESKSPVLINSLDQSGRCVCLRSNSPEKQQLTEWTIQIEVDDNKPLIYKFETKFNLRTEETVTVWAEGCYPVNEDPHTNKQWDRQPPWKIGNIAVVSLYNENLKLMDSLCEEMHKTMEN